jgi:hypothetical protein
LEIGRSHRMPNQWGSVGWGWHPFFVSPETADWGSKCETRGCCHGEAARSVLTKVRGDVFARFHAVYVAVETAIHSSACWDRCFALPQLLYRSRHQSGIFWIPSRKWKSEIIWTIGTLCLHVDANTDTI